MVTSMSTQKYESIYGELPALVWFYAAHYGNPVIHIGTSKSGESVYAVYQSGFGFELPIHPSKRMKNVEDIKKQIGRLENQLEHYPGNANVLLAAIATLRWVLGEKVN